jgi:rhodanese-related sulfurtransferase
MFGRLVNLPFKVLGTMARAVQERDKAQRDKQAVEGTAPQDSSQGRIPLDVPEDFAPGPIRIQAKRALAAPAFVVDVGSTLEWQAERPVGSTHIPAEEIDIRLAELPPGVRILIIARGTSQAERVVRFLRHRGLDDTWVLHGGLAAWKRAGGATEQG